MLSKITVSPAPHISQKRSTRGVMLDVMIALVPAMAAAVWYFRLQAVWVTATCIISCVVSEWVCTRIRKKPTTVGDLSAVLTGVILAFSLPPSIPLWVAVLGSAFAIIITKMLFGGLGCNVFNPAMASRAFLAASFGMLMTTWTVPATLGPVVYKGQESKVLARIHAQNIYDGSAEQVALTQATPLGLSKEAIKGKRDVAIANHQLTGLFWGQVGGCLGETSSLALLIGGVYLHHPYSRRRAGVRGRLCGYCLSYWPGQVCQPGLPSVWRGDADLCVLYRHRPGHGTVECQGHVDLWGRCRNAHHADPAGRRVSGRRDVCGPDHERRHSVNRSGV
jgi:Na+-translocating ferredoxin:NAD+ oxidoreductase RnfD subunit